MAKPKSSRPLTTSHDRARTTCLCRYLPYIALYTRPPVLSLDLIPSEPVTPGSCRDPLEPLHSSLRASSLQRSNAPTLPTVINVLS
ncbi:hypothetical protein M3J09_000036 [Ascochyta lentis]